MNETVTRNELDIHLKSINDRITFNEHVNDVRISAIKDMLDSHLSETKALIERNIAEHKVIANAMSVEVEKIRADFNDLRGDVKALSAKVDSTQIKFGWYLALFGLGLSVLLFFAQKF